MIRNTENTWERRLEWLERLYDVHEAFVRGLSLHCRAGCAICCTRSVTVTTLEAIHIVTRLAARGERHLLERLQAVSRSERFRPRITLNGLAAVCMNGGQPPEDPNDPGWGACPFLEDEHCLIYPIRPFGCRLMVSTGDCAVTGCAEMPDLTLTVNQVLQQTIEHADAGGLTGNLIDVLALAAGDGFPGTYGPGRPLRIGPDLLKNLPAPILMAPPAHRETVSAILKSIGLVI